MNGQAPIEDLYTEAAKGCVRLAIGAVVALVLLGWLIARAFAS